MRPGFAIHALLYRGKELSPRAARTLSSLDLSPSTTMNFFFPFLLEDLDMVWKFQVLHIASITCVLRVGDEAATASSTSHR